MSDADGVKRELVDGEGPTNKKAKSGDGGDLAAAAVMKAAAEAEGSTIGDLPKINLSESSNLPFVTPGTSGVTTINDNDVLSGRGGGTNLHPGNRQFRDLINLYRRDYLKARKNDKPAISRSIVNAIREKGGRFLKKIEKSGLWFEIGDDAAREKTSQALRQRAPEMRKLLLDHELEGARAQQQQQMMMGMPPIMMPGMNMNMPMMMPNGNFNPAMMGMPNAAMFNPAMMGMPPLNFNQNGQGNGEGANGENANGGDGSNNNDNANSNGGEGNGNDNNNNNNGSNDASNNNNNNNPMMAMGMAMPPGMNPMMMMAMGGQMPGMPQGNNMGGAPSGAQEAPAQQQQAQTL